MCFMQFLRHHYMVQVQRVPIKDLRPSLPFALKAIIIILVKEIYRMVGLVGFKPATASLQDKVPISLSSCSLVNLSQIKCKFPSIWL